MNPPRLLHCLKNTAVWLGCCLCLGLSASTARAQLALPTLPTLPAVPTPQINLPTNNVNRVLNAVVTDASTELNTQAQPLLRAARIRNLLNANPSTLEADPNGQPIVRRQLLALSPSPAALQAALNTGFSVIADTTLPALALRTVTLQAPPGMTTRTALRRLRALDRNGNYDYNHIYITSGTVSESTHSTTPSAIATPIAASNTTMARIGLIDAGVDNHHPALQAANLHLSGCNAQPMPSAHGTAVASLLVGQTPYFSGAAPTADLYAVDVYCGQVTGGSITGIAAALAWLVEQQVTIINISLVGPDNVLLKQLVQNVIASGHIVVAAVGNDGPAAAPLYPASYPDVIGVTAVDTHDRVLIEACRGKQVDFSAPGAEMAAATLNQQYAEVRGTSFAAPLVAGLLAHYVSTPQRNATQIGTMALSRLAQDLGSRGYDKTYGYGVVGESLRVALTTIPNQPEFSAKLAPTAPHH